MLLCLNKKTSRFQARMTKSCFTAFKIFFAIQVSRTFTSNISCIIISVMTAFPRTYTRFYYHKWRLSVKRVTQLKKNGQKNLKLKYYLCSILHIVCMFRNCYHLRHNQSMKTTHKFWTLNWKKNVLRIYYCYLRNSQAFWVVDIWKVYRSHLFLNSYLKIRISVKDSSRTQFRTTNTHFILGIKMTLVSFRASFCNIIR